MSVHSLVYISSAAGLYDTEMYRKIARDSGEWNAANAVSGMLLVFNETIIQFLEGEESDVEDLYRRIEIDPRHKNPFVVSRRELAEREFSGWTMGFHEIILPQDPGFMYELSTVSLAQHIPARISDVSQALLSSFRRTSGLQSH